MLCLFSVAVLAVDKPTGQCHPQDMTAALGQLLKGKRGNNKSTLGQSRVHLA